jgi:hypothetical protein
MPVSLEKRCPSCGLQHELYLPVGSIADKTMRFQFVCPKTQAVVPLVKSRGDVWKSVEVRPRDSILVYEVHDK